MHFRQAQAPAFFLGLFDGSSSSSSSKPPTLLAFINGTLCTATELQHETMSQHDPNGSTLCIHSVVVQPTHRRTGLATGFLTRYAARVLDEHPTLLLRLRLITKAANIALYQRCGFHFLRVSPVVHGKEVWFEMGMDRVSALASRGGRPFVCVDAFTAEPFGGNPAAVVFCRGDEAPEWMQNWAREINLSETAFVTPTSSSSSSSSLEAEQHVYALRWFTPLLEVDLCGHATLAAAHALWVTGRVPPQATIHFETKSGRLSAAQRREEEGTNWILLDFPAEPASPMTQNADNVDYTSVYEAFYCQEDKDIVFLGRNRMDMLVVLTPQAFRRAQVTSPNISKISTINCRGVIATCVAEAEKEEEEEEEEEKKGYDFYSRFFAPRCSINEDPVTGSAHCCLAPYWGEVLGKTALLGYQASARGGVVRMELDAATARVHLGGQAVLVKSGVLGV